MSKFSSFAVVKNFSKICSFASEKRDVQFHVTILYGEVIFFCASTYEDFITIHFQRSTFFFTSHFLHLKYSLRLFPLPYFIPYFLHSCRHPRSGGGSGASLLAHTKYVFGKCSRRSAASHGTSSVHVHGSGVHQKIITRQKVWGCDT